MRRGSKENSIKTSLVNNIATNDAKYFCRPNNHKNVFRKPKIPDAGEGEGEAVSPDVVVCSGKSNSTSPKQPRIE